MEKEKKDETVQLRKNRTLPSERLRNLKRIRAAPAVLAERKNLQDSKITLSGGFIMITREDVIEELKRRGYEAVAITRMKNGISFDGILIHDGRRVVPFIRTGTILDKVNKRGTSINAVVECNLEFCREHKNHTLNMENLSNREFVLRQINVALQKVGSEEIVKKPCSYFGGVEQYLYISEQVAEEGQYFLPVTKTILSLAGIKEKEAWEAARKNLHDSIVIQSSYDIFTKMMGSEVADMFVGEKDPMYIISSTNGRYGASAVLDSKVLADFARRHGVSNLLLLPSSVHEVIIILDGDAFIVEAMVGVTAAVNRDEVEPEEQLSDTPFLWTLNN